MAICTSGQDWDISIHALRGEGDSAVRSTGLYCAFISIHALRGEGDHEFSYQHHHIAISIHALRGEGDG